MTHLELLVVVCLTSPSLRDQINPEDFEQPLRFIIERMKAGQPEAIIELQQCLLAECEMYWDGSGKVSDAILVEAKQQAAAVKAKRLVKENILKLDVLLQRMNYPNIAGREAAKAAVAESREMIKEIEANKCQSRPLLNESSPSLEGEKPPSAPS